MTRQTKAVKAEFGLVQYCEPGKRGRPIGVLLLDPANDQLWFRFRENWDGFPQDAFRILANLTELFADQAQLGGRGVMEKLEDAYPDAVKVIDRKEVSVVAFPAFLEELFATHVR